MKKWFAAACACVALSGCERQTAAPQARVADGPQLEAPAPESEPARRFAPASDAARAATGGLTITETMRLPDADNARSGEVMMIRAANGLIVEAMLVGATPASAQIDGQPVRALMGLPVEASQTLSYRVAQEGGGASLCDAGAASAFLVWESETPGAAQLRILPFTGGAPNEAGAESCTLLDYTRTDNG